MVYTVFNTPRGEQTEPLHVQVWPAQGNELAGVITEFDKLELTWADRAAGYLVIECLYDDTSKLLLDTRSQYILVVDYNGIRHASTVVEAELYQREGADGVYQVKATAATPWAWMSGVMMPPNQEGVFRQSYSEEFFEMNLSIPIALDVLLWPMEAQKALPVTLVRQPEYDPRGEQRYIKTRFNSLAELVEGVLAGSDYMVRFTTVLPGEYAKTHPWWREYPHVFVEVSERRTVRGLEWSTASGDILSWRKVYKRPSATRVVVGDSGKAKDQKFYRYSSERGISPWGIRESFLSIDSTYGTGMDEEGRQFLVENAASESLEIDVNPATGWEFGADGKTPFQYTVGDKVHVTIGDIVSSTQVITEVRLEATPVSLKITPKLGDGNTRNGDYA